MEIVNANAANLCNYEVLKIVEEIKENKVGKKQHKQLATIAYETMKYLKETPCIHQTPEKIDKFLLKLNEFKLTKAEKLMLLNNPPTSPLEIQVLVDESEDRLSEEDVENLLKIVIECEMLPPQETDEGDEDGTEDNQEEGEEVEEG